MTDRVYASGLPRLCPHDAQRQKGHFQHEMTCPHSTALGGGIWTRLLAFRLPQGPCFPQAQGTPAPSLISGGQGSKGEEGMVKERGDDDPRSHQ